MDATFADSVTLLGSFGRVLGVAVASGKICDLFPCTFWFLSGYSDVLGFSFTAYCQKSRCYSCYKLHVFWTFLSIEGTNSGVFAL